MSNNKNDKKKEYKFTEEQQSSTFKYLAQRLAFYGVRWFDFKEEVEGKTFYCTLPKSSLGIFCMALESCHLVCQIWNKENGCFGVQCELRYEHNGGGSNGCRINLKLHVSEDGKTVEDYQE